MGGQHINAGHTEVNQPRNEKDEKRESQAELDGSEPFFNLSVLAFNYSDMSSRWNALDVGAESSNVISNSIHRSFSIEDKGLDLDHDESGGS